MDIVILVVVVVILAANLYEMTFRPRDVWKAAYDAMVENFRWAAERHSQELRSRSHDFDTRERKYQQTIRELTERVVRLKRVGEALDVEDGESFVMEVGETRLPYSFDLVAFLNGLETDDARLAAEDFIEAQRIMGRDDEQILSMLSSEQYE